MKRVMAIMCGLLLLASSGLAQQKDNKEKLEDAKKKAADERSRSFGRRTFAPAERSERGVSEQLPDPASKTENDENTSDESGKASQTTDPNKDQNQSLGIQGENASEKSNAPAVIQTTTSESGSPAVLSDNNGKGRDGTNNVQRGSYKMAGAEVREDMGLYKRDNSEKNVKPTNRIRKQEEQPARITSRPAQAQNNASTDAAQKNEDVVKKETEKKETKKQKGKSKKSGRSGGRDSGK